jgi:hypothetical protein
MGMKLVFLIVAVLMPALGAGTVSSAVAGRQDCGSRLAAGGRYGYAGHEAKAVASGVRATITALVVPHVATGHVAAWVGVEGVHTGSGTDDWLQAGIASLSDGSLFVYVEVSTDGGKPAIRTLETDVRVGESHRLAVAALTGRPGWWRVWIDGAAEGSPVHLSGSSGGGSPIATAESFTVGAAACNSFAFRFDRVEVVGTSGGGWEPFLSERRFFDRGYALQQVTDAPFAFVARSVA